MAVAAFAPTLLPALVLCGYLIFAPNLRLFPRIDIYDERRLIELFALVLACLACAAGARSKPGLLASPPRAWRAAGAFVVACGVASALRAQHPREALLEVALLVALAMATAACALGAAANRQAFRRCVGITLLLSAALAVSAFMANLFGTASVGEALSAKRLFPSFTSPRFLGQWQTWTLPLIALPLHYERLPGRTLQSLVRVIAVGWWMLAFAAGTRGTMLGIALGLIATALLVRPFPRRWLAQQTTLALSGALAFVLAYTAATGGLAGFGASISHLGTTDDSGRLALWHAALELIRTAPLLGVGPHHYGYHSGAPVAHPHNVILQLASEWGLPAALVILGSAAVAARGWLRWLLVRNTTAGDRESEALRCALTTALFAAAVHASLSGVFVMPISQVAAAVVLAWAWAESSGPVYVAHGRVAAAPSAGWPLACALWLVLTAGPDVLDLGVYERAALPQTHFRPRVWKEGASNFSLTRIEQGDPAAEPR